MPVRTSFRLLLVLLTSCLTEITTPEQLNSFVQDESNGLKQKVEINGLMAEVVYLPTDLLVSRELGNSEANLEQVNDLRQKYSNYHYFILSLSKEKQEALNIGNDFGRFGELVKIMSFRMTDYVSLSTNVIDSIPVGDFILNRTYGMTSSTDLLFVFSKEKTKECEWVQFNLNEFGLGIGNQRFRFQYQDLKQAPEINLNVLEYDAQ